MTIRAQQPARDLKRERVFLHAAAGFVTPEGFVEHAELRLEEGETAAGYGNRWAEIGIRAFVKELREEAADLGAWAALADQALTVEDLHPATAAHVRAALQSIARRGAQAHHQADVIDRVLDDAARKQRSTTPGESS